MGFLDDIIASAKSVVGKAEEQTDKVVELSKLKYQSAQLSSELRSLYEKLGRAVYAMMNEEQGNQELVNSLAEEITEVRAAQAVVEDKLNERLNRRICPSCGAQNVKEAVFCMKCGALLKTEAPAETPAEECCCAETPAEECCCGEAPAEGCCCGETPAEECCCGEAPAEDCCCNEDKDEA
ncbi:MAG: hypothetical protein PUC47_07710 [Oscillospiraceae bacterium]|nr:hypothetical protein [Oscillospiraceae bacterium]